MRSRILLITIVMNSLVCASLTSQPLSAQVPDWAVSLDSDERVAVVFVISSIGNKQDYIGKEFTVTDDQSRQIQEVMRWYQNQSLKLRDEYRSANQSLASEDQKAVLKKAHSNQLTALVDESLARLDGVLLPHQIVRVKQLAVQYSLKLSNGLNVFGMLRDLADKVEISGRDKKTAMDELETLETEYYEELAQLNEKYKRRGLNTFPKAARDQIDELVGEIIFDVYK